MTQTGETTLNPPERPTAGGDMPMPAVKLDPETLVLRGAPQRVTRFRKQAIIALACLGAAGVGELAWLALAHAPHADHASGNDQDASPTRTSSEVIAGAPRTYGDVPRLGPPLPGDLGKPILDHQQSLGGGMPLPASDPGAQQAALAARQNRDAARKSALESGVMMQISGGGRAGAAPAVATPTSMAPVVAAVMPTDSPLGARLSLDPEKDPGSQQRKADFMASRDTAGDANPHDMTRPTSPYTLMAGTILAASLITGVNSDLPGLVVAQVTENAYDTTTGRILLIPQGSRLIGSYDSVVAYGQKRALLVWQRIILPDGSSVRIDNVPASDMSGYAGLADKVDVHTWQLLKGVVLSTMLAVSTQLSFGSDESDLLRALRQSTQQSVSRAGDQIVGHALAIQPTITVRPGWPLRVVVHKDIIMGPWAPQGRQP